RLRRGRCYRFHPAGLWGPDRSRRRPPLSTLSRRLTDLDERQLEAVGPVAARHRHQVAIHARDQWRQLDASMARQIRAQIVRPAAPFVDRATAVSAPVVQTAGGDLDQTFVKAAVRTVAVGHPGLLPGLVCLPVEAAVEQLDAALKAH